MPSTPPARSSARGPVSDRALVLDASAMVDLLVTVALSDAVRERLMGQDVHVPGHFDAEVLAAVARLTRAGDLTASDAAAHLERLAAMPYERHHTAPLVIGAWHRRGSMRVADALYVELGARLGVPVVTTDAGMAAAASNVELLRPA